MPFDSTIIPTIDHDAAFVTSSILVILAFVTFATFVTSTTINPFATYKGPSFCATTESDLRQVSFTTRIDDHTTSFSSAVGIASSPATRFSSAPHCRTSTWR